MNNLASDEQNKFGKLSVVSLFSGCGGMDLGATLAGCNVIFANDISKNAIESLHRLLPSAESYIGKCSEIKTFPTADIVCGGYPCQSFSMGGRRLPATDERSALYLDFIAVINKIKPKYFIVENVPGLVSLDEGRHFKRQLSALSKAGEGYRITWQKLNAAEYGVPQRRSRVFVVGVRRDLDKKYEFPLPTHGSKNGMIPQVPCGEALKGFEDWPLGEFYSRQGSEEDNFPWYFMSRNRRSSILLPSFTIVANWRHTPLHPASPIMKLTWSNLSDGWKQRWDFTDSHEQALDVYGLGKLENPRRLSWRECASIQTFPKYFEPVGDVQSKIEQIGNAVPPLLAKVVFSGIVDGTSLVSLKKRSIR